MSFTDQKPFTVTEADTKTNWGGGRNGKYFRCYLCGHKFIAGDIARWIAHKLGNFMVCQYCDKDCPEDKWQILHTAWEGYRNGQFWHFIVLLEDNLKEAEKEASAECRELQHEVDYWKREANSRKT